MNFGEANKSWLGKCSKETSFEILDYFFDQGGNFIDTANLYQQGESETLLGEWMAERDNRDQIVLATKYTGAYLKHDTKLFPIQVNYCGNGTKSMRVSLESSLRKLQTDYIDIFYVHWWDYTTSIPELMHSLNDLVVSGKVLYLGISDTPAWVVAKANQYARCNGLRQFVVYQGMWNAAMRDFERDIIPMCRDEGMGICPYGVVNQGRFRTEEGFKEREKDTSVRKLIPLSDHDKAVSRVLERIANRKGSGTELTQVALAYVMHKATHVFPVVGGRKLEHLKGNIAGLEVSLTAEELAEIDSAYNFNPGFPHNFLSGTLLQGAEAPQTGAYSAGEVTHIYASDTIDHIEPPKPIVPGRV